MDVAKHLYDISMLFKHDKIQTLLGNKDELIKLIGFKRQEEKLRIGGIDENISIPNLIYTMEGMLKEVFKKDVKVRLRPGYFPFTEPGFELDCSCTICDGKGCPTCKNSGWLELCPCGMIHPNVLKEGGIDSTKYSGFAFGLGLTRLAMMKYKIGDIRVLNSGDLRYLEKFNVK